GKSLAPLLLGRETAWPERFIFTHWGGAVSVRSQRYRLDNSGRMYDLTRDPGQERDISKDRPKVAAYLAEQIAQWKRDVLSSLKREDRPYTVGYREFPRTWLPARDGVPHGGVHRSAMAPNCSFFTNW